MSDVVIVRAGLVGASVAYRPARRAAAVTLIDRGRSAAGVTGGSFGWIGSASGGWPCGSKDLRGSILEHYRQFEGALADVAVRWTGSLSWTDEDTDGAVGDAAVGPEQLVVGPSEVRTLEPHLLALPKRAVHSPTDAGVDPAKVTYALVRAKKVPSVGKAATVTARQEATAPAQGTPVAFVVRHSRPRRPGREAAAGGREMTVRPPVTRPGSSSGTG